MGRFEYSRKNNFRMVAGSLHFYNSASIIFNGEKIIAMRISKDGSKVYIGPITHLDKNQIAVVGTNTQGRHGRGLALWAMDNAGLIYGMSRGLIGQSYGIVTKDLTKSNQPSIPVDSILSQINILYKFAADNPNFSFLIPYTAQNKNLNGYSSKAMADMFFTYRPPDNIVFEVNFLTLL